MSMIVVAVAGVAVPQGSKRVVPTKAGHRLIEANEKALRPWRAAVADAAHEAMRGREPLQLALRLECRFQFARPKAHYRSDGVTLRDNVPSYRAVMPDLDKLVRAICDGMTGIVFRDDAQIVELIARKTYGPAQAIAYVTEV